MAKTLIWAVAIVVSAFVLATGNIEAPPKPKVTEVTGTVDVGNFPATQDVAGAVEVSNLPLDEDGNLRVSSATEQRIAIRASDFPLTIQSPGSYYLVENVITDGDGITIEADNVTIDLMGFTIDTGYENTIYSTSRNVTIMNGALIANIDEASDVSAAAQLGSYSTVRDVTVYSGEGCGICVGPYSLVHGCQADGRSVAISAGRGSVVEGSVVHTGSDLSVGISVVGSIVRGCTIGSGGTGISARDGSHVLNSHITANWGVGLGGGSVLADSTVWGTYTGINVGSDSIVRGCRVEGVNDHYSINVSGNGNTLLGNNLIGGGGGGPALRVSGNSNRFEGNTLRSAQLKVDGMDNVIVKNTSHSWGDSFDIAPGNVFGPIVNVAGGGDLADFTNSDHPLANFEY